MSKMVLFDESFQTKYGSSCHPVTERCSSLRDLVDWVLNLAVSQLLQHQLLNRFEEL